MGNFDVNSLIAATIGFLGVIISIYFSKKINKQSQEFQQKLNEQNNVFQIKLNKKNNFFQEELSNSSRKNELWDKKFDLLIALVGSRTDVAGAEFTKSINSINILFYDSPEVLKQLDEFYIEASKLITDTTKDNNNKLLDLFESIMRDLNIFNRADFNDRNRLLKVFNG